MADTSAPQVTTSIDGVSCHDSDLNAPPNPAGSSDILHTISEDQEAEIGYASDTGAANSHHGFERRKTLLLPRFRAPSSTWRAVTSKVQTYYSKDTLLIRPPQCRLQSSVELCPEREDAEPLLNLIFVFLYHSEEPSSHGSFGAMATPSPPRLPANPDDQSSSLRGNLRSNFSRLTHWLKDSGILPDLMPHYRAISVGYDADTRVVHRDSSVSFDDAGIDLLDHVYGHRIDVSSRPTILIGHGYGCWIIQQAIARSNSDQTKQDLLRGHCTGVIFFDAPVDEVEPMVRELASPTDHDPSDLDSGALAANVNRSLSREDFSTTAKANDIHERYFGEHTPRIGRSVATSALDASRLRNIASLISEWLETDKLLRAVKYSHYDVTRAFTRTLTDRGIDLNQRKSASGKTALHVACQNEQARSYWLRWLLEHGKVDVRLRDESGSTALHYLVVRALPDGDAVKVLLEAGADADAENARFDTPRSMAKHFNKLMLVPLLQKRALVVRSGPGPLDMWTMSPHSDRAKDICQSFDLVATQIFQQPSSGIEKHFEYCASVLDSIYGSGLQRLLENSPHNETGDSLVGTWYHLPCNNMTWAEHLFRNQLHMYQPRSIWAARARESAWAHGRCIEPHATKYSTRLGDSHSEITAICIPYISYEDAGRQRIIAEGICPQDSRQRWTGRVSGNSGPSCEAKESSLMRAYLTHEPPLHIRRTLDQYFYDLLADTSQRDADQVVARWACKELGEETHNLVMVDQLWLWCVKHNGDQPETIITCFPPRNGVKWQSDPFADRLDDLQDCVLNLEASQRPPITSTQQLVVRIMGTCLDLLAQTHKTRSLAFLRYFEGSVSKIGSEQSERFEQFKTRSNDIHRLNPKHPDYMIERDALLEMLIDIRGETNLLWEAKDLRDEVNIILDVLHAQQHVLQTTEVRAIFRSAETSSPGSPGGRDYSMPQEIDRLIKIFDKMYDQMDKVCIDLTWLLDMKQKQANVWEARSTREGAQAARKQGNVMVIFTMVTIIFLPLSFMASFFALDIQAFPSDATGQTRWPLHQVASWLFGISFAVSIPFIAIAFAMDVLAAATNWTVRTLLLPALISLSSALSWPRIPSLALVGENVTVKLLRRQREYTNPYKMEIDRSEKMTGEYLGAANGLDVSFRSIDGRDERFGGLLESKNFLLESRKRHGRRHLGEGV